MGKGLGRVQKAVLADLESQGQAAWLPDIARRIWEPLKGTPLPPGGLPRPFTEALARAVRTLERDQLLRTRRDAGRKHAPARARLCCWLPDQKPPPHKVVSPRAFLRKLILLELGSMSARVRPRRTSGAGRDGTGRPTEVSSLRSRWRVGLTGSSVSVDCYRLKSRVLQAADPGVRAKGLPPRRADSLWHWTQIDRALRGLARQGRVWIERAP